MTGGIEMKRSFPFTIKQVAEILKLKIRYDNNANDNMDADCPFCQKKSKLNLNAVKNVYRCNFCGEYGGMVQLYGKVHGVSNSDAYREMCEILGCSKDRGLHGITATEQSKAAKFTSRTTREVIHQTYSMLLNLLTLATPHREQLLARGLSQEQIDTLGYKSVPAFGQKNLCEKLLQSGCILEGVPGFYNENGIWNVKLKAQGVIIPVVGIDGKIAGLQIRLNKPINERKYIWVSSLGLDGGASPGSPVHFIGDPTAKRVYVTDGVLKGSVAHALTGHTFICLPGMKNMSELDKLLVCLKANGTIEAVEAFGINKLTDEHVAESAVKLRKKLSAHGFKVVSAIWDDKSLSGVDDYYVQRANSGKNHVYDVNTSPNAAITAAVVSVAAV